MRGMTMDDYISLKEFVSLTGIPRRTVFDWIKKQKINFRYVHSIKGYGRGKQIQIHISELQRVGKPSSNPHPQGQVSPPPAPVFFDEEVEMVVYSSAPEWARRKADKYLKILKESAGLKGDELKEWIMQWNEEHPEMKTSYQRVMEARKAYQEQGIAGLLARYGKRAGESSVKGEWFEYFKRAYLREGAPSLKSCWLRTLGYAKSLEPSFDTKDFPSPMAFLRRLKREIPEQAIYLARYGREAWNRKYGVYIERDYSNIVCGEVWVSDHAQVDVAVVDPRTDKVHFPWVTAWRDFKSGKWLGWLFHIEAPNSDHVFQSFYYASVEWGLPQAVYIDNGKDYRCRDFAGGRRYHKVRVDEKKATAMLALLKITPHFSLPYNAQAKTIERDFLKLKEYFSKHLTGYRGGHTKERPEKLKEEIKSGEILRWDEFVRLADEFIKEVLNNMPSQGKVLRGLSPNQLWSMEVKEVRKVTKEALRLFCMRTSKPLRIGRNGVADSELGVRYWAEWMAGMVEEYVYLRRDVKAYEEAWVFRASDDEYLGRARIGELAAAALAKTEIEKSRLKEVMALKKRHKKIAEAYRKTREMVLPEEAMMHMAMGVKGLSGPVSAQEQKVIRVVNSYMDQVVLKDREMQREGEGDLSKWIVEPERKKIYLFESDKE